ncbi:MAG TPA: hypothetical protein VEX15_14290 [Nocardioidaceae bacterium]|nr:hypothetical protein [Nocardioidaceae bacterium]
MAAMLNPLSAAAVVAGLFALGVVPRLTVDISVTATGVSLLEALGPGLNLPDWLLSVSPFHHLAAVPAESFATTPAAVMVATGAALAFVGHLFFDRRDVVSA